MSLSRSSCVHQLLGFLTILPLLALMGCGPTVAKVSGKVSYQDKVVKGGIVMFVVEGKGTSQGRINEDGTYSIPDVPAGTAKVCVDTSSLNPAKVSSTFKYSAPKDAKAPEGLTGSGPDRAEMERRYVSIPERYADPNKTTITTTISGGMQEYNIKLDP